MFMIQSSMSAVGQRLKQMHRYFSIKTTPDAWQKKCLVPYVIVQSGNTPEILNPKL